MKRAAEKASDRSVSLLLFLSRDPKDEFFVTYGRGFSKEKLIYRYLSTAPHRLANERITGA
jgi:hypothetical protein